METIARIPSGLKLHKGNGKYIFKKALQPVLPNEILRRRKWGFSVPLATWFRRDLKDFAYETVFSAKDEYLNYTFLEQCWTQHQRGQRDWSSLLWQVLMFKTWQKVCNV
jgi:asparagine synthase (glutamine-hydrolysing)